MTCDIGDNDKAIGDTSGTAFISSDGAVNSSVRDPSDSSIENRPAALLVAGDSSDVGNKDTPTITRLLPPLPAIFLPDNEFPTFSTDPSE